MRRRYFLGAGVMHGFHARLEIPCPIGRCTVLRNGVETHSRLLLCTHDKHGRIAAEPYYQCERGERWSKVFADGEWVAMLETECFYRTHPVTVNSSNMSRFVVADYRALRPKGERPGENVPERRDRR